MENSMEETSRRRGRPPVGLEAGNTPLPREEMRDSLRGDDSLTAAARRAAELRGHSGGVQEDVDDFYVDPDMIPEGWSYEWKRHLLLGAEDPSYNVSLARAGWEPVPVNRDAKHRAMMPMNWTGSHIERKGMILMQLPTEIVEENKAFERKKARDQVKAKEAQLSGTPEGTLSRDDPRVRPSINKGWEAMPVPKS
jgi:hypothetical protein